jgi:hypothetical protein
MSYDRDVLAGSPMDRDCEESEERVESVERGVGEVRCVEHGRYRAMKDSSVN